MVSMMSTAPGTHGQGTGMNNALAILAQALAGQNNPQASNVAGLTTTVSTSANYDKFGTSDRDGDCMCTMCGLKAGQGAGILAWFEKMNAKGNTKDGQRTLLRKRFGVNLKYEEDPIPCTFPIHSTFTGDGDYHRTTGVMKGLSPLK